MAAGVGDVRGAADPTLAARGLPHTVLAVSDLHVGQGKDPETGRYCRHENFFGDAAFESLLRGYRPAADTWLVLNGDTFDFLRITATPHTAQELGWATLLADLGAPQAVLDELPHVCKAKHPYGLATRDYESVWKLLVINRGHPTFFQALRDWVALGGHIVFVKGNHDVELRWPLVRSAIRALVGARTPPASHRVHFRQTGLHLGNLYFEHGHRFERATRVHGMSVLGDRRRLRLPFGSLVNRYVINNLEGLELFFSNIKPVERLLWSLLRHHPLKLLGIARHAIRVMPRAVRAYCMSALWAGILQVVTVVWLVALSLGALVLIRDWMTYGYLSVRSVATVALILLAPALVVLVRDVLRKLAATLGEDAFAAGAYKTLSKGPWARRYKRPYGVLGHTHVADVQKLPPLNGVPMWYVNTGTWAPRFEEARPDLMGKVVHSVVRFDLVGGEYAHECIEWTPPSAVYSPATLFEPTCGN